MIKSFLLNIFCSYDIRIAQILSACKASVSINDLWPLKLPFLLPHVALFKGNIQGSFMPVNALLEYEQGDNLVLTRNIWVFQTRPAST